MTLPVWFPCPHLYRHLVFHRGSHHWRSDCARDKGWQLGHPWNRGGRSDRTQHSALDFGRVPRGTHDSIRASRGIMSSSGCAGATGTASILAGTTGEGCTGGTSSQAPSDDHADKAGLSSTGRQTHVEFVDHLVAAALSGARLRPCRPRRPVLALCHGGRI
jgi:hypothetical protein